MKKEELDFLIKLAEKDHLKLMSFFEDTELSADDISYLIDHKFPLLTYDYTKDDTAISYDIISPIFNDRPAFGRPFNITRKQDIIMMHYDYFEKEFMNVIDNIREECSKHTHTLTLIFIGFYFSYIIDRPDFEALPRRKYLSSEMDISLANVLLDIFEEEEMTDGFKLFLKLRSGI